MKQETLINVQQMNMFIINEPDAQTINLRHSFYNVLMILLQMKISWQNTESAIHLHVPESFLFQI